MNDLDTAIREALLADETFAPDAPSGWIGPSVTIEEPHRRSRPWLIAACALLLVVGVAALAARSDDSDRPFIPAAPTPTDLSQDRERAAAIEAEEKRLEALEAAAEAQHRALVTAAAQERMVHDVVAATAEAGWNITLPTDLISQSSTDDGQGVQYFEVRLSDGNAGELLVSTRTGDADAVAAGTTKRTGLLQSDGTISIYLVTDSPQARAVELFDGTTIIYVRSESPNGNARTIADLTTVATALNHLR